MDADSHGLLRLSNRPSLRHMPLPKPGLSVGGAVRPATALDYAIDTCTIGRAMEILGEKWTVVVLREVFNGVRRFDDMRAHTGIPRQVLTNRLGGLVES